MMDYSCMKYKDKQPGTIDPSQTLSVDVVLSRVSLRPGVAISDKLYLNDVVMSKEYE